MKSQRTFIEFLLKEWLLIASAVSFVFTVFYVKRLPAYSINEIQVLFLLFVLFVTVNGLQKSRLISKIAKTIEQGKLIPLKLVVTTFFLSMLITNDIALLVIVPLTLSLSINKKGILVILEALAANSGSALTPVGNPQNLFIYWFYKIPPETFIKTIAPFSLLFLVLLILASLSINVQSIPEKNDIEKVDKKAYFYGLFLIVILLSILHLIPLFMGSLVILFALFFDRKSLRIDYALLLSFFFFFGVADNLKMVFTSEINHAGHIFLFSALTSQVMSNVPSTLLFAKFTSNWQALLWGVNAGGFGSLLGSLANLIAYKIYVSDKDVNDKVRFTVTFLVISYIALFVSAALYVLLYKTAFLQ